MEHMYTDVVLSHGGRNLGSSPALAVSLCGWSKPVPYFFSI